MKMKNFIKRLTVSAVTAIMLSSVNAENTNIGFKEGNFSGWKMETGDYYRSTDGTVAYEWKGIVTEPNDRFTLINSAFSIDDPIIACDDFMENPFSDGSITLKIGASGYNVGAEGNKTDFAAAERAAYTFTVTEESSLLTLNYACVINDGSADSPSKHQKDQQPYFGWNITYKSPDGVVSTDSDLLFNSNDENTFVLMQTPTKQCPFSNAYKSLEDYRYLPWTTKVCDFTDKVGYEVTITFLTHDCLLSSSTSNEKAGGHEAYGYFHVKTAESSSSVEKQEPAKLEFHIDLASEICKGDSARLIIDTVGTEVSNKADLSLKVFAKEADGTEYEIGRLYEVNGLLEKKVSPSTTTSYRIEYKYQDQLIDTTLILNVIDFHVELKDTAICEGQSVELSANVLPEYSYIEWYDADMKNLGSGDVLVFPEYEGTSQPMSVVKYYAEVRSFMYMCKGALSTLNVTVYRPLSGNIEYKKYLCEGETVTLDASDYEATTYSWIIDGDTVSDSNRLIDTPKLGYSQYMVHMTRGVCEEDSYVGVSVNSAPKIKSIDSLSFREVDVVMDPDFGTEPFMFRVDDREWSNNSHIESLTYSTHTIMVMDAIGCVVEDTFVVNAPDLPFHGDGVESILADKANKIVNVYTASGVLIKSNVKRSEALEGLENGVYLVSDEKVVVKK